MAAAFGGWSQTPASYFDMKEEKRSDLATGVAATRSVAREVTCTATEGIQIIPGSIIMIVGQQNSGKSTLMKHIVRANAPKFNKVFLMNPLWNAPSDRENYRFMPDRFKYAPTSGEDLEKAIGKIMQDQEAHPGQQALVIIDDCMGLADTKGTFWKRLGSVSRKLSITFIVCYQSLAGTTDTVWRDNARAVFVLRMAGTSHKIIAGIVAHKEAELHNILRNAWDTNPRSVVRFTNEAGAVPQVFIPDVCPKFWLRYIHPAS